MPFTGFKTVHNEVETENPVFFTEHICKTYVNAYDRFGIVTKGLLYPCIFFFLYKSHSVVAIY